MAYAKSSFGLIFTASVASEMAARWCSCASSGAIWHRWLGWSPESIQELKAIVIPVLIMLCKSVALTLGFAYRPVRGQLPEPAARAKLTGFFRPTVSRKYSVSKARNDIVHLVVTGAIDGMDLTAGDLAKRWGVSRATASEWMRQFCREKLIVLERGRGLVGNRLLARAAPAAPKAAITH